MVIHSFSKEINSQELVVIVPLALVGLAILAGGVIRGQFGGRVLFAFVVMAFVVSCFSYWFIRSSERGES